MVSYVFRRIGATRVDSKGIRAILADVGQKRHEYALFLLPCPFMAKCAAQSLTQAAGRSYRRARPASLALGYLGSRGIEKRPLQKHAETEETSESISEHARQAIHP